MKFTIQVLDGGDGTHLAVLTPEGTNFSASTVAGAHTECDAAANAVDVFFNNKRAKAVETLKEIVTPATVEEALSEAIRTGKRVRISGTKVSGERYFQRLIKPSSMYGHDVRYVTCVDALSDDARTFRIDGIAVVEVAA